MNAVLDRSLSAPAVGGVIVRSVRDGELLDGDGPLWWNVRADGVLKLIHRFTATDICDDALVAALSPLVDIGALSGHDDFECAAVQIILGSAPSAVEAWNAFYDNTLRGLEDGSSPFAPIHRQARSLVSGDSVLEVGSCFGFLAIQLARDGRAVSACDLSQGAVALLEYESRRYRLPISSRAADATALPYRDSSFDTVTLIHLLEHLEPEQALQAIREAMRVARHAVIIAVPFEEEPSEHFGHKQKLTAATLREWARQVPHAGARGFDHHGGWLLLKPAKGAAEK